MNACLVATVAVLAGALGGCASSIPAVDEGAVVREASEKGNTDAYGLLGSAVLSVDVDGGTYQVTMGARARTVLGVDSEGNYHAPREKRCVDRIPLPNTICRVFELPPGVTLTGFVLRDVYWPVN